MANADTTRKHYIDWLRVLAVLLLFDFHTARLFDGAGFYVKNAEESAVFDFFVHFVSQWHMHLFFFLSGVGACYGFGRRGGKGFAVERFKRLFLPLLFGTFVIVAPQVFYRFKGEPGYDKNYFEFYPTFFHGVAPDGNFEWGHLWFLAYLFVFSLIAIPIFTRLRGEGGKKILDSLVRMCARPYGILLLALPIMLFEGSLRIAYPNGNQNLVADWANFLTYIYIFILGFALTMRPEFTEAIDRIWKVVSIAAFVLTAALIAVAYGGFVDFKGGYIPSRIAFEIARGLNTWLWLIMFLGAGKAFLNFKNRILTYANQAVLPIYILHQTAIIIIGFYVVQLNTNLYLKFIYIDLASLAACLFIYDVLIKRWNPVRFLFGMRPKPETGE
jgi:glucans biosynthesis protein C